MILPLFGGILLDKIGLHFGLLITITFVTVGQLICAIGGFQGTFWIMLVGRVLFGVGCETLWCVQAAFVGKWFFDQEMSFAIGFGYAVPNLCSFGAGWWVPGIAADPEDEWATRENGIGYALGTSALVCLYSWVAAIFLIMLDRNVNQIDERKMLGVEQEEKVVAPKILTGDGQHEITPNDQAIGRTETFEENQVQKLLDARPKKPPTICQQICSLELGFWLVCLDGFLTYSSVLTSVTIGQGEVGLDYEITYTDAGSIIMATYLVSAITMPLFGLFGDNCGHRVELMILGGIINISGHFVALWAPRGADY